MSKDIDSKRVTVVGSGVEQGLTGTVASFQIQGLKGQLDKVHLEIDGPAQPTLYKGADENGNINVTFKPNLPGTYQLSVQVNHPPKHIKGSPFTVDIMGESDPKYQRVAKVEVAGKGVTIGRAFQVNEFWIDGRNASIAAGLSVHVKNPERASSGLKITDMKDGTFKCTYKPTAPGQYVINVKVEGIHVPGSPFWVRIT